MRWSDNRIRSGINQVQVQVVGVVDVVGAVDAGAVGAEGVVKREGESQSNVFKIQVHEC